MEHLTRAAGKLGSLRLGAVAQVAAPSGVGHQLPLSIFGHIQRTEKVETSIDQGLRGQHLALGHDEVRDAAQAVFVECFKEGGVLDKASETTTPDFRAYLFAVVRNVARRFERNWMNRREGAPPSSVDLDGLERSEATLSEAFDRAWAESVVGEALALQEYSGEQRGEAETKRFELLRLRFQEGLPIREIARRWQTESRWVHGQYKQARKEFEKALLKVVHFHHPDSPERAEAELSQVLFTLGSASLESEGS